MDDLLPGMLRLTRDGGETLTSSVIEVTSFARTVNIGVPAGSLTEGSAIALSGGRSSIGKFEGADG